MTTTPSYKIEDNAAKLFYCNLHPFVKKWVAVIARLLSQSVIFEGKAWSLP